MTSNLQSSPEDPGTLPRVLIVGAGAVGAFYGALLHRGGACVEVVARSDAAVVRADGYRIDSPLGDLSFRPAAVYDAVEAAAAAVGQTGPDYLVLAVKVLDDLDRAALIKPAVRSGTAIVLIENGIDIEAPIAAAFPQATLISGIAFIGACRTAPGRIHHQAFGRLVLGDYPGGIGSASRRFAALLEAGGMAGKLTDSVVTERWRKCVWNAAFNPVSVLAGGADTRSLLAVDESLLRLLMQEVCNVAAAEGHPLPENSVSASLAKTRDMPAYKTSMALDFLAGRPLETEAILGNVVRAATRYDLAVPHLRTLYGLLRLRAAGPAT
ncbi:ketopantoate reductase family protein [Algihabitans albus]|uniref:ketopantoate reductase family protein n=1 Tax=Algihabitans albus TaxID=2164067 RepID=UPI001ABCC43C|nr:2-dehydropantoate 2-reductase [Algihabitans albus]